MVNLSDKRSPARRRLLHLMRIVLLSAVGACVAAVVALWAATGPPSLHMLVATCIGVFGSVLLGGGLMALVFMSAGTGHDERVRDWKDDSE